MCVDQLLVYSGKIMVTRYSEVDQVDVIIDEIAQRILLELESASSADLSDSRYAEKILHLADIHYAKRVLQQIGRNTIIPSIRSRTMHQAMTSIFLMPLKSKYLGTDKRKVNNSAENLWSRGLCQKHIMSATKTG